MDLQRMVALTQELVSARGPCGQEDEVRQIVLRELEQVCDKVWVDAAGNAIGLIRGAGKRAAQAPVIKVMAHMDELALIVKRVEDDGRLRVRPLGGLHAWVLGLGPVEIMGDHKLLPGVLSLGPLHTSQESEKAWKYKSLGGNKSLDWIDVTVFTRLSPQQLADAGVHAGTRIVVPQARRELLPIGDCLAGYFFDDRVCLTIMLAAAAMLKEQKKRPPADVYLVGSCVEELGGVGATFAARALPGDITLAIDVGPTAQEYNTVLNESPIIAFSDARTIYTKSLCDRLLVVARQLGLEPQLATWASYGSDASIASQCGQSAMAGLLCIPTDNTHGYEIIAKRAIENCARVLSGYLQEPMEAQGKRKK